MTRRQRNHSAARRVRGQGVSLIEALLALVVMSLGMLAVVGVQATLRGNSDLSRQRAEAVRLAQEDVETWRTFTSVNAVAGVVDFTDVISAGPIDVSPAGANAAYRLTRTVPADPPNGSPPFRTLAVSVQWTDRAGNAGPEQRVDLVTTLARIAPALSASLSVPPNGAPARQPMGQHAGLPRGTVPLGDGTSSFTPPQPSGTETTSLIFNSLTGQIIKICIKVNEVTTCTDDKAQLVTGYIRAALPATYPQPLSLTDAQALDPASTAGQLSDFLNLPNERPLDLTVQYTSSSSATARTGNCYSDPMLASSSTAIEFFCVVRLYADTNNREPTWSGTLQFGPTPGVITDNSAGNLVSGKLLRVCRYKPASASYTQVSSLLSNQNFLLIAAGDGTTANACPASVTHPHQPAPS